jgi:hypothetical protein
MTNDENKPPTDPEILHTRIHEEWEALAAIVSALDEGQILRRDEGEWSVKDILAHIAAWEKFLIMNQFLSMSAAESLCVDPDLIERADEDEINAVLFERNRDKSLAEVHSDWFETHRWLMSELAKVDEERLRKPTFSLGKTSRPLAQWVVFNTYGHYKEHRRAIEARRVG